MVGAWRTMTTGTTLWTTLVIVSQLATSAMAQTCGGDIVAGSGVIRSPNYPNPYPTSSSCVWTLQTREDFTIKIKFKSRICGGDSLSVYDGSGTVGTALMGEYCGTDPPAFLKSGGRAITVVFQGSGSAVNAQRKFEISYESIDDVIGSRVIWSEVDATSGKARLSSFPSDPELMRGPLGQFPASLGTLSYYDIPRGNWTALASRYGRHEVIWGGVDLKTIIRGSMGNNRRASGYFAWTSSEVYGIAVDWLTGNAYWTDAAYDWIMMYNADGSRGAIVVDQHLDIPTGIAIHPSRGMLFWTDSGSSPKLERSNLAGENRIELVSSGIVRPQGVTIDYQTNLVYWVDADPSNNRIEVCGLDGSNRRTVYSTNTDHGLTDLTVSGDYIYVVGKKTRNIIIVRKDTGAMIVTSTLVYTPFGIMTYAPDVQQPEYSPCSSNPCSYLCVGRGTDDFTCMCGNGQLLESDGRTCAKEGTIDPPQYFVATQTKLCRYPINLPDMNVPSNVDFNVSCFLSNRVHAVAMAVDLEEGIVFYSDIGVGGIGMGRLRHGSKASLITGGTKSVQGMAVDWLTKHLYWTDYNRGTIEVSKYNGTYRTTLLKDNVIRPRSIAIDPKEKYMFWTEFGPPAQIERASLDGTERTVIASGPAGLNFFIPSGLAIDYDEQRIYYAEVRQGTINSMDYNGGNKKQIMRRAGAIFFDIALYKDYILWTELGRTRGIYSSNRHTGTSVRKFNQPEQVFGITTYADTRQEILHNPCRYSNGGCDQLCLSSKSSQRGYVCHCTLGFYLAGDGKTCNSDIVEDRDNFFLVTDTYRKAIFQVDMSSTFQPKALSLSAVENPIAVTFNPDDRKVYWTDVAKKRLSRASLDGSDQEVVVSTDVEHPDGIAVDAISDLLYWTDAGTRSISVSQPDGSQRKTLITGLSKPRAIVLHPARGLMFWTDWGDNPSIERAQMDGSSRSAIVSGLLTWPNGLTLDYSGDRLYWCDAGQEKIESSDLSGNNRRLLIAFGHNVHPFDVAVVGNLVYWTDWVKQSVLKADKSTGRNNVTVGPSDYLRPNAMYAVISSALPSGSNDCSNNNGGCSGLCLPTVTGKICTCADGFTSNSDGTCLQDNIGCPRSFDSGGIESTCTPTPGSTCSVVCIDGYFPSVDQLRCLATGSWDMATDNICRVQECPRLDTPANAILGPCERPYVAGKLCTHSCRVGTIQTGGQARRTCNRQGQNLDWLGTPVVCEVPDEGPGASSSPNNCDPSLVFITGPQSMEYSEDDLVTQECRVSSDGSSNVEVAWYKDDQRLESGLIEGVFIQPQSLIIPRFKSSHEGQYSCVALSEGQKCIQRNALWRINALSFFEVVPQDAFVSEGDSHVFACSPKLAGHSIAWLKDGEDLPPDAIHLETGTLILPVIREEHEGTYTCQVRSPGGQLKGSVDTILSLSEPLQLNISAVCGTVTYRKSATSSPPTSSPTTTPAPPGDDEESNFGVSWSSIFDNQDTDVRIVGGSEAEYGSAPYMARIWNNVEQKFTCGGSLLDQQWILTAAHCIRFRNVVNLRHDEITVFLGDHDSHATEKYQKAKQVAEVIIHRNYDDSNLNNDIALLRISPPLRSFNDYIRPICMAPGGLSQRLLEAGKDGRITGWGRIRHNGPTPRFLKEVSLPYVGRTECQRRASGQVPDSAFCAGYFAALDDACQGDSGGPFAITHKGRWYLLGIVSAGEGCAQEGKYGYYTRVPKFLHWIRSKNATVTSAPGVDRAFFTGENASIKLDFNQKSDRNIRVAVGSSTTLECYPNRDDAVVQWYIRDTLVTPGAVLTGGVSIGQEGLTMLFPSVQMDFTGEYRCQVSVSDSEGDQMVEARFNLDVSS